jgi:hypothetical protein
MSAPLTLSAEMQAVQAARDIVATGSKPRASERPLIVAGLDAALRRYAEAIAREARK